MAPSEVVGASGAGWERAGLLEALAVLVADEVGLRCRPEDLGRFLDGRPRPVSEMPTAAYLDMLKADRRHPEWMRLHESMTIPETFFFRNRPQWEAFRRFVAPQAFERASREGRPLRLWSAGCSTGEEPYTAAIELRECLPPGASFRIVATDLVESRLESARSGRFKSRSMRGVADEEGERYFHRDGGDVCLRSEIRSQVEFEQLNLADRPAVEAFLRRWAPLDVILCRNVLIYFEPALITWLLDRFADAVGDGTVVLGHADFAGRWTERLEPLQIGDAFVWRRAQPGARASAPVPVVGSPPEPPPPRRAARRRPVRPRPAARPTREAPVRETPLERAGGLIERIRRGTGGDVLEDARAWATQQSLLPEAHYVFGVALENAGETAEAASAYAKVVFLDGSFAMARWRLSMLLAQSGRLDRASREARAALRCLAADSRERLGQLCDLEREELERIMEDTVAWIESLRTGLRD